MAGSLQDQLLKAGLVSEDQLQKAEQEKRQSRVGKKGKRKPKKKRKSDVSLEQAYAQRAQQEKRERDQALNQKREEARRRKELNERLQQLIQPQSKNDPKAERSRFFEWHEKIRKVFVTEAQQKELNDGRLGVVHLRGRFHLVPAEVLDRVKELKPDAVAFYAPDQPERPEESDIPDDLMW